ncbi:MAG: hypothetical protein J6K32_08240 [Clostridia bacterium]|nr:hypothetical protein [Clostridia bacterium]
MSRETIMEGAIAALAIIAAQGWRCAYQNKAAGIALARHLIRSGIKEPDEKTINEDVRWAQRAMREDALRKLRGFPGNVLRRMTGR